MSTPTSSSSSNRCSSTNIFEGVPNQCWCGGHIRTFVSKTNDNPSRRFYRCELASQRKDECHVFKWVDEALLDEIKLLQAQQKNLVEVVNDYKKLMIQNIEENEAKLRQLEGKKNINISAMNGVLNKLVLLIVVVGAITWFR
ncbi:unnamed protein product [Cochlearia groenlandica]